jgi:hypothetical protein
LRSAARPILPALDLADEPRVQRVNGRHHLKIAANPVLVLFRRFRLGLQPVAFGNSGGLGGA